MKELSIRFLNRCYILYDVENTTLIKHKNIFYIIGKYKSLYSTPN